MAPCLDSSFQQIIMVSLGSLMDLVYNNTKSFYLKFQSSLWLKQLIVTRRSKISRVINADTTLLQALIRLPVSRTTNSCKAIQMILCDQCCHDNQTIDSIDNVNTSIIVKNYQVDTFSWEQCLRWARNQSSNELMWRFTISH
jgi:hypothetical protein